MHKRKSDGSIFYVGKGHGPRFKSKSGRSKHWLNIAKKNGVIVEFFASSISESEAFEIEIALIKRLRESGENICNIYNGGEGPSGFKHTEETKMKFRIAKLGKPQMPSHAEKSRIARLGKRNTPEMIAITKKARSKKIINSSGEIFSSATDAARVLSRRLGKKVSQGNISFCANGFRSQAYGYTWSYDLTKTPLLKKSNDAKKMILCSNGKKFNSVQDAKKWVKGWRGSANNQCISKAAREGCSSYGFKWEYIL